uniref:glutathione transferase n=2 Tax=Culex pipiens TaxID=7175 RepID=A0A8D8C910_CULPI
MPVDLYCNVIAPFCRSVMLLAKALDIEMNLIDVNVLKREQYKPEFLALNPQHCIPTVVDGDVVVWESNAILIYLAEKYGTEEKQYYPKDIGERAKVNRLLFFQLGALHRNVSAYYFPILMGGEGKPEDFRKVQDTVCILNKFLEGNRWLAGDQLTVADFSVVISVAALEGVVKFDLSRYRNVCRWYQLCKQEFQGFEEMTMEATNKSKECFEALRKYKKDEILMAQESPCCSGDSAASNDEPSSKSDKQDDPDT